MCFGYLPSPGHPERPTAEIGFKPAKWNPSDAQRWEGGQEDLMIDSVKSSRKIQHIILTYYIKSTQIYLKNIEWMVIFKSSQQLAMLMLTQLIKHVHVHYKFSVKVEPTKK